MECLRSQEGVEYWVCAYIKMVKGRKLQIHFYTAYLMKPIFPARHYPNLKLDVLVLQALTKLR